jgi:hypothetical protein
MTWNMIFFIISAVVLAFGIYRIIRVGGNYLSYTAIAWFTAMLFMMYLPNLYDLHLINGIPSLGKIVHYIIMPILLTITLIKSVK